MKVFALMFTVVLLALPVIGLTQLPQTTVVADPFQTALNESPKVAPAPFGVPRLKVETKVETQTIAADGASVTNTTSTSREVSRRTPVKTVWGRLRGLFGRGACANGACGS